jgi:hypothetical protein
VLLRAALLGLAHIYIMPGKEKPVFLSSLGYAEDEVA